MAGRRLAFVITELDDGGAERALVRIATGLNQSRWDVSVVCLGPDGPLAAPLSEAGIPVVSLGVNRRAVLTSAWQSTFGLARTLRRLNPDLVQTFLFHGNTFGRIAARMAQIPCVVSGIRVAEHRSRWRLRIDRWTERLVRKHVCVSQSVAEFSEKRGGLDVDRIIVIPNGVDVAEFQNATPSDLRTYGVETGTRVVLSVGRLDEQKNPLGLVNAFYAVTQEVPNVVLLLAGTGPMESQVQQAINDIGLTDRIYLLGRRSDIPGLMKSADVFVLASRWEGMANVLLEAGAAGLPVVCTRTEGCSEIIDHGVSGVLVGIDDGPGLSRAICRMLSNPSEASAMGHSLQTKVSKEFTWSSVIAAYDRLYDSLLRS